MFDSEAVTLGLVFVPPHNHDACSPKATGESPTELPKGFFNAVMVAREAVGT